MIRITRTTEGTFLRFGRCNRCGECCSLGDPFGTSSPVCLLLERDARGRATCAGYRRHPVYLNGCNVFPSHPSQITHYPSCAYRFVKIWRGRKV